jgi:hypothetical protein
MLNSLKEWSSSALKNLVQISISVTTQHNCCGNTKAIPGKKWNDAMRERLVKTQDDEKHQKGSWHAAGDHGAERGGRLYNTAMSTLILESYYRHGSLYSNE